MCPITKLKLWSSVVSQIKSAVNQQILYLKKSSKISTAFFSKISTVFVQIVPE
jgi:hypothetical protein